MIFWDIETDNLLDDMTKITCLVMKDTVTDKVYRYKDNFEEAIEKLNTEVICGHNIIKFDIPALQKIYPSFQPQEANIIDTLVLSRLIYADLAEQDNKLIAKGRLDNKLYRSHSLKAWGQRLGFPKDELDMSLEENRIAWSQALQDYCERDVEVTQVLYNFLDAKDYSVEAIELEHKVAHIVHRMEQRGVLFNVKEAEKLHAQLLARKFELETELQTAFPPREISTDMGISKVNNSKTGRVKGERYFKVTTEVFNPGSRQQIASRLIETYGWKPKEFTPAGQPKVDETTIAALDYPECKLLQEYLMITKRLGQLAEGDTAWLKVVKHDSRIHHTCNTGGTVTGRCSHNAPNVAQTVAVNLPWGPEFRSLFHAPAGWTLVGADLSGLELRALAHFCHQFDDGNYTNTILSGDVHTANQLAAGLSDRAQAKRFIYALIYGAGSTKIGEVVGGTAKEGQQLKDRFFKNMPALKKLIDGVGSYAERNGYIPGLDKRRLTVRSAHKALNVLLQSAGALIAKKALIIFDQLLKEHGYQDKAHLVLFIHDEFQIECEEGIANDIGQLAVKAFEQAGQSFNFNCPITGEFKAGRDWASTH